MSVRESFSLTVFTRNRRVVQQLLQDVRDVALPFGEDQIALYGVRYAEWSEQMKRSPRSPQSVVLRRGVMEDLLRDCRWFLESRRWFLGRGIPYRRGYLLHGPPGTGKSSAVLAVASALRMDIAILNLASANLEDHELLALLADVPANAILLIEDIDCVFVQRKATDEKANRVTFSGLAFQTAACPCRPCKHI
jgi:chaperone BCS1